MKTSRGLAVMLVGLAVFAATTANAQTHIGDKHLKIRIAVAPIDYDKWQVINDWQIPVEFRNAIDEKLDQKLLDTGRFVVLERQAMEALLQEQSIKEANTGQSEKGKIVAAQALVRPKLTDFSLARRGSGLGINVGSIGRVGGNVTQASVGVNIALFDVDTSELLESETAEGKASSSSFNLQSGARFGFADFQTFENSPLGDAMNKALDGAVAKILDKLKDKPWTARVADFDSGSKEVTINAGVDTGVLVGDTFDVMHVTGVVKDPDTGEVLRVKSTKVGRIKIKDVQKKFAVGDLIEGTPPDTGDIVQESKS